MSDWKQYKRKGLAEMRPYMPGEDLSGVSISEADKANGSPKEGDMIACNLKSISKTTSSQRRALGRFADEGRKDRGLIPCNVAGVYPVRKTMKETSLSDTIDQLAVRKANDFIDEVKKALDNALKDKWHAKMSHTSSEYRGADIKSVLLAYANYIGTSDYKKPAPSASLINICRKNILDDILDGLPRLKELALMQTQAEVCPQCGTAPCHCESAE